MQKSPRVASNKSVALCLPDSRYGVCVPTASLNEKRLPSSNKLSNFVQKVDLMTYPTLTDFIRKCFQNFIWNLKKIALTFQGFQRISKIVSSVSSERALQS